MSEIRVDPLSGLRTIVAPHRADRGRDGDGEDPFAEGNEGLTPAELYAVRPEGGAPDGRGWRVRVVPNRFPALREDPAIPARDANAVPGRATDLQHKKPSAKTNGSCPTTNPHAIPPIIIPAF